MSAKHDPKRGRHKKRASRETKTWEADYLLPKCPSWMDATTYRDLNRMRMQA